MSTTMANISAAQVKELRDKTGAPMMDCKQALTEAKGDLEQAIVVLRKKGVSVAAKKAARVTSEGSVGHYIHAGGKIGVNVVTHGTFACHTRRFLGCNRNSLFAQHDNRLFQIALGFGQGLFAVHHRSSGFVAEFFNLGSGNICHSGAHQKFFLRLKLAVIKLDPRTDQLRGSDLVLANSWKLAADARTGAFPPAIRQRLPWRLKDACACPCPARLPCGSLPLRVPRLRIPQQPRRLRFRLRLRQARLRQPGSLLPVRALPPPECPPSACRPWHGRPRQSIPISSR